MEEKNQINLTRRTARAFLYGSLGTFGILVFSFLLLPSLLLSANAAQQVSVSSGWNAVTLSIDPDYGNGSVSDEGHGNVEFGTLTPQENYGNSKGTMRVEKKTIGVTSTGKYYSVYLSTSAANTDLVTGLKLSTDSGITIPAIGDGSSTGTWSSPVAFSDSAWGYAVPTKTGIYTTPFSATTYATAYNSTDGTIGVPLTYDANPTAYNQGTWAGVPNYEEPQQIWEVARDNTAGFDPASDNDAKFDVYYAVMVDTDVLAGTYSNNIVYTAISSAQSIDTASKNISRNKSIVTAGDQEILNFDLAASLSGDENNTVLTRDDFYVFLVPHTVTASAGSNYTVTNAMLSAVSDDGGATIKQSPSYNQCAIGSGTDDFQIGASGAVIKCTMPESAGGIEDGTWNGSYDFWVYVPRYNISYISKYTRASNEVATVYYVGLQSNNPEVGGSTKFITAMQDMTPAVCKNTNIWGKGTGTNAKVYAYNTTDLSTSTEATPLASVSHDNDYLMNTGTFLLTDERGDNKDYLIRRLADGNCWMVQNLDLDLRTIGTLTSENTDLNTKSSWNPITGLANDEATTLAANYANLAYGTEQYQFGTQRGTAANTAQYYWGTVIDNSGNLVTADTSGVQNTSASVKVINGSHSAIPRSYDNGYGFISGYRSTSSAVRTIYKDPAGNGQEIRSTVYNNDNYYTNNGNKNDTNKTTTGHYYSGSTDTATTIDNSSTPVYDWLEYATDSTGKVIRDSEHYGTQYIGDYYNWYAATAASGNWDNTGYVSGQAGDSICPKGWSLPVNGTAAGARSWGNLLTTTYGMGNNADSAAAMHLSPLSIPFSGNYGWSNGNLGYRGSNGYFWSSTPGGSTNAYNLNFYTAGVNPAYNLNKTSGLTVRCVARS